MQLQGVEFPLCPIPSMFDQGEENPQGGEASLSHLSKTPPDPFADASGAPTSSEATPAVCFPELPPDLASPFDNPGDFQDPLRIAVWWWLFRVSNSAPPPPPSRNLNLRASHGLAGSDISPAQATAWRRTNVCQSNLALNSNWIDDGPCNSDSNHPFKDCDNYAKPDF